MTVTWKKLAYEDDVVLKSLFDVHSILVATIDNTPVALPVGASSFVGRTSIGDIEALTAMEARSVLNVEDGADVTDAANVAAAGAMMDSDLDGKGELLVGDGSGPPTALAAGTDAYVLTADSGEASGVKWAAPGAPAAHASTHKNGGSDELLLSELGEPTAAVALDGQQITDQVIHTVADETAMNALTPLVGKICWRTDTLAPYFCTSAA